MSFLHPAVLLALPAVLIPLIIHLLNRRRFRKKSWGAMQFLREALEEKRGQRKLKHWLLMAVRMLAVASLVIAASRPLVGGWLAGWLGGGHQTVLILLDRSASMSRQDTQGRPKREQTLERLVHACQTVDPAEIWLLDSATGEPQWMENLAELGRHFEATDTQADLPSLFAKALHHWVETSPAAGEIWVVSDGQRGDWRPDDDGVWADIEAVYHSLRSPPQLRLLTLRGGQANRSIRCQTNGRKLTVSIRQSGFSKTTIPLTLIVNDQPSTHSVTLDQSLTEVTLDLPADGALTGSVSLPDDGNLQDNRAFFAVEPDGFPRVTLVCQDPTAAAILQLAAAPWPNGQSSRVEISQPKPEALMDMPSWDRQSLVIWQGDLPVGETALALEVFALEGGQILFFPHSRQDAATPGSWRGFAYALPEKLEPPRATTAWNRQQGPLRDSRAGEPLAVGQWTTRIRVPLRADPLTTFVQASDAAGEPCLITHPLDRGAAHFLTTLPLEAWSSLGEGPVLLPLIQRLLSAGQSGRSLVQRTLPQGPPWKAGVRFMEDRWQVSERPEPEDLEEEISDDEMASLLGRIPYQEFAVEGSASAEGEAGEWWRVFLFATLLFFLAENLLTLTASARQALPRFSS